MDGDLKFKLWVLAILVIFFLGGIGLAVLDDIYVQKICVKESK